MMGVNLASAGKSDAHHSMPKSTGLFALSAKLPLIMAFVMGAPGPLCPNLTEGVSHYMSGYFHRLFLIFTFLTIVTAQDTNSEMAEATATAAAAAAAAADPERYYHTAQPCSCFSSLQWSP